MDALLHSALLVALAEMGDKTQILTMLLAARYRKAGPIIMGMLFATLFNHGLAAFAGQWLMGMVEPRMLGLLVAALFIGIGFWVLVPDSDEQTFTEHQGAFTTTLLTFFIAEMGDKTQLATMTLAGEYPGAITMVILGTTLGIMLVNVPAVFFGRAILERIKMSLVRKAAAFCFIGFGLYTLIERVV